MQDKQTVMRHIMTVCLSNCFYSKYQPFGFIGMVAGKVVYHGLTMISRGLNTFTVTHNTTVTLNLREHFL